MQLHLKQAIDAAIAGHWELAHDLVMDDEDAFSCWIHAVLHKIKGEERNSRYWYQQTQYDYADFVDPKVELLAIKQALESV